jgi:tRNA-Thr(GGU) m(6)t(6)A37 methyltransferase TsaA
MTITIRTIGTIHTPYKTKEETPIQGNFNQDSKGTVEVFPEFEEGLKDIETFTHIILLYQFDKAGEIKLVRPTFLDDVPHGVFASRHPCRPSGIGLTVTRLLARSGNRLEVAGIDVLDGTPLLDIKPYILRFDCFPGASEGWISHVQVRSKPAGRE